MVKHTDMIKTEEPELEMEFILKQNIQLEEQRKTLLRKKLQLQQELAMLEEQIPKARDNLAKLKSSRWLEKRNDPTGKVIHKVFSKAQRELLLGRKKVFWGDLDLAKAFSLRHIAGKECYLYLRDVLNIPLPALSAVQRWAASYTED